MIKLYGFGSYLGLLDVSPFVMKVDAYLRMSGIEFTMVGSPNYIKKSPKGKVPFIEDDGELIVDSSFIIMHIKNKYGDILNAHLDENQKAQAYLITKSLDENFYWCIVNSRWVHDDAWPLVKKEFFGAIPFLMNNILAYSIRRGLRKTLYNQGLGRHTQEERLVIAQLTLASLSNLLGEKQYFFGNKPSCLDASAYGFLNGLMFSSVKTALTETAKEYANLVDFCLRIKKVYYDEI